MLPSVVPNNVVHELLNIAKDVPNGAFVEVGVYQGGTAYWLTELCKIRELPIFLYDTFTGIPYRDEIDHHQVGDFSDTNYQEVKSKLPYATVVAGVFPDSAVEMPPIAFAHIDCDQYKAVRESVEFLMPKMLSGGVIWFDDYCLAGARQAIHELFGTDFITSVSDRVYVRIK